MRLISHPLASSTWGDEEIRAINDVVDSGLFTMGQKVSEFERRFAEYIGVKYAVAVNSGSSANLIMVAAYTLKWGKGVVIVPAIGWATSYSPFQQYGWKLVFVDVNRDTLNHDPILLWKASECYDDPVILAINILGNPNEFSAFPRKCHVLEDNCESLGAEYWGKKTGSFGRMGTHSFYFAHHMSTVEGGMVTTDDEELYQMLLCLRSHGWTRHLPEDNILKAKVAPFEFIYPGYNVRATELVGAIGLAQLDKLDGMIERRRENASRFPLATQKEVGKSSWYGFCVYPPDVAAAKRYCEYRPVVTGNFTRSPSMKYYDHEIFGTLNNADFVHDSCIYVGNHSHRVDWSFL